MTWQPQRGERVTAVLPDGHEIEGTYVIGALTQVRHHVEPQMLHTVEFDDGSHAYVLTVKPAPTKEPTAFGACVTDAEGSSWVRLGDHHWYADLGVGAEWRFIKQPVTVVNADPWARS